MALLESEPLERSGQATRGRASAGSSENSWAARSARPPEVSGLRAGNDRPKLSVHVWESGLPVARPAAEAAGRGDFASAALD